VQTASLAPAVLFSLPAGVLADSLDRRRLLIVGSAVSALIAGVLTVIAALHHLTPWTILGFTFLLALSLIHILLEFPLDSLALRQLGAAAQDASRVWFTGRTPKAAPRSRPASSTISRRARRSR
jgi:MFS family permease